MTPVEELIEKAQSRSDRSAPFDLWVPEALSLRGEPVSDAIAMVVLGDAILGEGFEPAGFSQGDGGRTYHYKPFDAADSN